MPPVVHEVLASPGQPLDATTRAIMEPRFGHDLSQVRIHADAKAAESARTVKAAAYALGTEVVFGEGQYSPLTLAGQRLLAHELAHTLQQTRGSAAGVERISDPRDPAERDADRAANDVIAGRDAGIEKAASAGTLHRQPLPDIALRPPPLTARLLGSELLDGFALNSAELTEDHKGRLAILAHTLKSLLDEYPGGGVQITGHTDASGEEKYNEWLGQKRADAVGGFLADAGVSGAALASVSAGESELRVATERPEPRNRRVEVRFAPERRLRFIPSPELTPPGGKPEQEESPTSTRLCLLHPEQCLTLPSTSLTGGTEAAPSCDPTNCSAISVGRLDQQPPDLQRVVAASFKAEGPATWFARLDPERRIALTSIFNRMCRYGLWCHVRLLMRIEPGEPPVSLGAGLTAPGLTPSVHFTSPDGNAFLTALMATGRFCMASGAGASQHPGQTTLREISGSDSLHVSIGPGNAFDAHIDRYSAVPEHPGSSFCSNDPSPAAVGHIGREVVPEKARKLVGIPGFQIFPEPPPPAPVPEGAVGPEPYRSSPGFSLGGVVGLLIGALLENSRITLHGPRAERPQPLVPAEAKRVSPDVADLTAEVVAPIARALDEQVSHEALLPSHARLRRQEARRALEVAGPDEEEARRRDRDEAEAQVEAYPDAHEVAFDLAARMERARLSGAAKVTLSFESYGPLDPPSRKAITAEVRRIALILRNHLPDRAEGVRYVLVFFGSGRARESEVAELP